MTCLRRWLVPEPCPFFWVMLVNRSRVNGSTGQPTAFKWPKSYVLISSCQLTRFWELGHLLSASLENALDNSDLLIMVDPDYALSIFKIQVFFVDADEDFLCAYDFVQEAGCWFPPIHGSDHVCRKIES